jgi:ATP-binding cassette subfamily F protein 3
MTLIQQPIKLAREAEIHFRFAKSSTEQVFGFKNADIGWDEALIENSQFRLSSHMKLALVGANGCGKSTLLHSLAGTIPLLKGQRTFGSGVRLGIYGQDVAAQLPKDHTPISHLSTRYFHRTLTQIRTTLGSLGLSSDSHEKSIAVLSGGEKARVVLADLVLGEFNTLFLDEPTNHLDIETAHALIKGLQKFEGCILLVSHDRRLIEQISTHLGRIEEKDLKIHEGIEPEWLLPKVSRPKNQQSSNSENKLSFQEERKKANQRKKQEKQLIKIEEEISGLEEKQIQLDEAFIEASTNYEEIQRLSSIQHTLESELQKKMEEWEELSIQLS